MTFKYQTMSLKTDYIHDVISMTRVGTHTYEFLHRRMTDDGELGKTRVTDVISIQMREDCSCHNR